MIRRLAILLLVCGGLGFFLQREQARGTFDAWERQWLVQLQRLQGPPPPAPPVVLIELRRGDLPFESWPPAPLDYALVFESLVRRQPREVVVQPLLAWPGVESLDAATLAERIALLPRGVLACTLQRGLDGLSETSEAAVPLATLPGASGDVSRVPAFDTLGQVPIEELRVGKALGFTRIEFGDGMAARGDAVAVPLLARRAQRLVPSLVLQALLSWQQTAPTDVSVQLGRRLAIGTAFDVPVDEGGRQILSARLAPPLRRLDAGALLLDLDRDAKLMTERPDELATLRSLEGALVVLGETGESTPRFPVPGSPEGGWTEAEVVARSLVAALSGHHLREPPVRWQWAGWGAVVLLGTVLLGSPRRWLPVFALGGAAALALALALAFLNGQWWIAPVPPLGLWLAASVIGVLLPPARRAPPPAEPVAEATASEATPAVPPALPEPGPTVATASEAVVVAPAQPGTSDSAEEAAMAALTCQLAADTASDEEGGEAENIAKREKPEESALVVEVADFSPPVRSTSLDHPDADETTDNAQAPGTNQISHVDAPLPATPASLGGPDRTESSKPVKGGRKGHRTGRGRGPNGEGG